MKLIEGTHRTLRLVGLAARALRDKHRPLLAQIVPMRRCNLSCTYCNEYDKTSSPVPFEEVARWLDKLAALGTGIITVSGGEPMLHPDIEAIIAGIRARGMVAGLITNGYFLQEERIRGLNRAGLEYLQLSIDNVSPDEVSQKSLKVLDRKLENLRQRARFHININVVLGSGCKRPEDALTISRRAKELGFSTSVGIIHDGGGKLRPLRENESRVYREVTRTGLGMYTRIKGFQQNLVMGEANDWHCRAGARYLYICEQGLVHYCSQRRGEPGIPLAEYTTEDIARAFDMPKDCAPYCTIGCVHRVSVFDAWRAKLPGRTPTTPIAAGS